jgi:phosphoribosyl 1,2-cyclic phosphodiesterase
MSLASGSSGNCYYVGVDNYGILIDAGIAMRTITKRLKEAGIGMESIRAVLITHDHSDHIKGVSGLGERLHIPVYATRRTHEALNHSYCVTERLSTCVHYIDKDAPLRLADIGIEAFDVPHDSHDSVGYCLTIGTATFVFVTDLGEITHTAARYIRRANYLIIEANYDEEMLRRGRYPWVLQQRIVAETGHLSNHATAAWLADNYAPWLQSIWLCHLSRDNNTPELAFDTVADGLRRRGIEPGRDVELCALGRNISSPMYEIVAE